jgi:hypothetical protein
VKKPRTKTPPKFKGDLATPIRPLPPPRLPTVLAGGTPEQDKELWEKWRYQSAFKAGAESLKKLSLLLKHYEIPEDDSERWFSLAFALALDFVPGFAIDTRKPAGRRAEWDDIRLCSLWFEVGSLRRSNPKLSVSAACARIAKRPDWKSLTGSTLRQRYETEAKNSVLVSMYERLSQTLGIERVSEMWGEYLGSKKHK